MARCPPCGFMIPDGETECPFCQRDVSRHGSRPRPAGKRRHQLHDWVKAGIPEPATIGYVGFWKRFGVGFLTGVSWSSLRLL